MSIYLFPYMAQNIPFNATNINRSLAIHKILLDSLKETRMFIPEYKYISKTISLDDICYGKEIYGNNGLLEKLNNYEGCNIEKVDRLKHLNELNLNLNSLINIGVEYKGLLNKEKIRELIDLNEGYIEKIKSEEYKKNHLKCIEIMDDDICLDYEWLEFININKSTLINIVNIFKEITDIGLVIDKNCFKENYDDETDINPLDYFVFKKNGELKYFIGFNTILKNQKYLNRKTNKLYLTQNNIDCLLNFISIIRNTCYLKNIDISLFMNKTVDTIVKNKPNLTDFQDILNIIKNDTSYVTKNKKAKIGVFLDTANIYTGIKDLEIDFNYLLMSLYDIDALQNVKVKKATIVYQKDIDGSLKDSKYNLRNKEIEKNLREKYDFDIKTIYIRGNYSNQIDDEALKDIIRKNIHAIDKVLLMTGDKHFKEIVDLCKKEGKEIKVISVCEGDTAKIEISRHRNHSYIYKYWDCIRLFRG